MFLEYITVSFSFNSQPSSKVQGLIANLLINFSCFSWYRNHSRLILSFHCYYVNYFVLTSHFLINNFCFLSYFSLCTLDGLTNMKVLKSGQCLICNERLFLTWIFQDFSCWNTWIWIAVWYNYCSVWVLEVQINQFLAFKAQ